MSHRLLPTIVFASTSLLACGGQVDGLADASTPDGGSPDVAAPPDATDVTVIDAGVDADAPKDAGPDVRLCEGGWPTTKGQICTFEAGIACCTAALGTDGGIECCQTGGQ